MRSGVVDSLALFCTFNCRSGHGPRKNVDLAVRFELTSVELRVSFCSCGEAAADLFL